MAKKRTKKPVLFIEVTEMDSSNLDSLYYDVKKKSLKVTFKNGGIYEYQEVTRDEVNEILEADSMGSTFNRICIKGSKKFYKLN